MGLTVSSQKLKDKTKKPKWKVPFCPQCGHMQHYPGDCPGRGSDVLNGGNRPDCRYGEHVLRDPDPFVDELEFVEMEKGYRSGAWGWWKSINDGTLYCVTLAEIELFIRNSNNGIIKGRFGFRKKGNNFTIIWLPGNGF
jgi:hypothetical protein